MKVVEMCLLKVGGGMKYSTDVRSWQEVGRKFARGANAILTRPGEHLSSEQL